MPSASTEHEASEDTPLLPLASSEVQPRRASLLARCFNAFWGSCTCCVLAGSICLTISKVTLKVIADDGISVFQLCALRSVVALSMFVPYGYYKTGMLIGPLNSQTKWIFLRGFLAGTGFLSGCFGTVLLGVSESAFLNNSYPAFLAIVVWLLGIEKLDGLSWLGIWGAVISQLLIANPPFLYGHDEEEWDTNRIVGICCAFLCVTAISAGFLVLGKLDRNLPTVVVANNVLGQLLLISIPFLAVGFPEKMLWTPSLKQTLLLLLSCVSGFNQIFITRAFQIGPPLKAAIISLFRIIMIAGSGAVVLSEDISLIQGLGGVLMLASIVLVVWSRDRAKKRQLQHLDTASTLSDEM